MIRRQKWRVLLAAGVATVFAVPPALAQGQGVPVDTGQAESRCSDPDATYQTAPPESLGLDSAKLQQAIDYWAQHGSDTVKVFRHGCLAGHGKFDSLSDHVPHVIFSHTKTLLALVVGRAQTQGYLNVDDPIGKYLEEGLGTEAHRAITIRQLLNQTSGLHHNWGRECCGDFSGIPDHVRNEMSLPFDYKPGTVFQYANHLYTLPYVVERAVGQDFQAYGHEELFSKLGIPRNHWFWGRDRAGHSDGPGWTVYWQPIDFPRFGLLMLNDGLWHGQRLIDPGFLREMRTGIEANPGYGFLLWLNGADHFFNANVWGRRQIPGPIISSAPRDMYFSYGFVGQHVFVIPSLDMIVTRTGNIAPDSPEAFDDPGNAVIMGRQKKAYYDFFKLLMEAVTDTEIPPPPPYRSGNWTFDFDVNLWVNPEDNLAGLSSGPGAPEGCNILGCDGRVESEGWVQFNQDAARAYGGTVRDMMGRAGR